MDDRRLRRGSARPAILPETPVVDAGQRIPRGANLQRFLPPDYGHGDGCTLGRLTLPPREYQLLLGYVRLDDAARQVFRYSQLMAGKL